MKQHHIWSVIIALTLCILWQQPTSIHANEMDLDAISEEREEIRQALNDKEVAIYDVLQDIQHIHHELSELNVVIEDNEKKISVVEQDITKYEEEIGLLQEEIEELHASIEQRDEILKTRFSAYQANGGNARFIEVLFNATTFNDFISRLTAVTQITSADQELIQQQIADKEEVEKAEAIVQEKVKEQKELKTSYEEGNSLVKQQRDELLTLKTSLDDKEEQLVLEQATLEGESAILDEVESSIRQEIAQMEEASDDTDEQLETIDIQESEQTDSLVIQTSTQDNQTEESQDNNNQESSTNNSNQVRPNNEATNQSTSNSNNQSNNQSNQSADNTSKPKPKPKPKPQEESKPENTPGSQAGTSIISIANQQRGVKYVYGTMNPGVSFDCSGYVSWVFQQAGKIGNYRYATGNFATMGTKVDISQAQPGDLIFFNTGSPNSHVAIYTGGNQFIGAQTSTGVAVASLDNSYWKKAFEDNGKHVRRIN